MAKTSEYYKSNPDAKAKRLKQQKRYNKTKKGLALRVNANRLNRQLGTYGNGDGQDAAHYSGSTCLLYTSPSPRDKRQSRMPSSA